MQSIFTNQNSLEEETKTYESKREMVGIMGSHFLGVLSELSPVPWWLALQCFRAVSSPIQAERKSVQRRLFLITQRYNVLEWGIGIWPCDTH